MLSWLEKHMLPCAYKSYFGVDCPTCGFQRSLILLLKGNFRESLSLYPPLLFILAFSLLLVLALINRRFVSRTVLVKGFWVLLAVVSVNYIVKLCFLTDIHT